MKNEVKKHPPKITQTYFHFSTFKYSLFYYPPLANVLPSTLVTPFLFQLQPLTEAMLCTVNSTSLIWLNSVQ